MLKYTFQLKTKKKKKSIMIEIFSTYIDDSLIDNWLIFGDIIFFTRNFWKRKNIFDRSLFEISESINGSGFYID